MPDALTTRERLDLYGRTLGDGWTIQLLNMTPAEALRLAAALAAVERAEGMVARAVVAERNALQAYRDGAKDGAIFMLLAYGVAIFTAAALRALL